MKIKNVLFGPCREVEICYLSLAPPPTANKYLPAPPTGKMYFPLPPPAAENMGHCRGEISPFLFLQTTSFPFLFLASKFREKEISFFPFLSSAGQKEACFCQEKIFFPNFSTFPVHVCLSIYLSFFLLLHSHN